MESSINTSTVSRTGVWLVGARGSVGTTTALGAMAIRNGLTAMDGMVTALSPFTESGLPDVSDLVFGGHDISARPWLKKTEELASAGVLPEFLVRGLAAETAQAESELCPAPTSDSARDNIERIADDLAAFTERHRLARTVVIDVASTRAPVTQHPAWGDVDALERALSWDEPALPVSGQYAWAAVRSGCAYVDFTPSGGARVPALDQLARRRGVPYTGQDGKTGETLVKSVLAPMFACRNLRVNSWSSVNLLGGGDGATLSDPAANAAKTASKSRGLAQMLGYLPDGQVRIDEVPALGDAKTAWDLVTFSGFLGARMRLEFTWSGLDSALAAPLVLDLARLTARAHEAGHAGPLEELAFFFKDPVGAAPHDLATQWRRLCAFAAELSDRSADSEAAHGIPHSRR